MIFFALFANDPEIIFVPAGKALFVEGQEGHLMFVLTEGSAETYVNNRMVERLESGNIVGEMGLVAPGPRTATVIAKTDCQFVAVDEKRFLYLIQQAPYFATSVMKVLAERLRATNKLVLPIDIE